MVEKGAKPEILPEMTFKGIVFKKIIFWGYCTFGYLRSIPKLLVIKKWGCICKVVPQPLLKEMDVIPET